MTLLRARRYRPHGRAAECRDELAPYRFDLAQFSSLILVLRNFGMRGSYGHTVAQAGFIGITHC
jgi:hypothetical protein